MQLLFFLLGAFVLLSALPLLLTAALWGVRLLALGALILFVAYIDVIAYGFAWVAGAGFVALFVGCLVACLTFSYRVVDWIGWRMFGGVSKYAVEAPPQGGTEAYLRWANREGEYADRRPD